MPKGETYFVCQSCGFQSLKWLGRCPDCQEWNTFLGERTPRSPKPSSRAKPVAEPRRLAAISPRGPSRWATGVPEFDRVLGGGVVPGSIVLVAGDPGIGKSTLLLEVGASLASQNRAGLYLAGEESLEQIRLRAERLKLEDNSLALLAETDLHAISACLDGEQPEFVVVDSIQALQDPDLESIPGTISQIRQACALLTEWAKRNGAPLFIIGHVTKSGAIAGPKTLEHLVDTVLYFEGERHGNLRLLRATKNRFGSTDELGVFDMTAAGLLGVPDPSQALLAERPCNAPGSAVACVLEGTRPLLVEIQALVTPAHFGTPQRSVNCLDRGRAALILAVLEKRAGLGLADHDVFLNVAGGVSVNEPAADLAVALAVASSFRDRSVPEDLIACGELGLAGEIRTPTRLTRRSVEAGRMGFERFMTSRHVKEDSGSAGKVPDIIPVRDIAEALDCL